MTFANEQGFDETSVRRQLVTLLPRMRRFAYALTGNEFDADDLVQGGVERALERLHQWRPGSRLDSWMFRIIHNLRLDQVKSKRARSVHLDIDEATEVPGVEEKYEAKLALDNTLRAMSQLPPTDRALMVMVCIEGMSYREASSTLDIPVGTVMSRLARARKRLYDQVERGVDRSVR